jgi:hypothetical protein
MKVSLPALPLLLLTAAAAAAEAPFLFDAAPGRLAKEVVPLDQDTILLARPERLELPTTWFEGKIRHF